MATRTKVRRTKNTISQSSDSSAIEKIKEESRPYMVFPEKVDNESKTDQARRFKMEEEFLRACLSQGLTRSEILQVMGVKNGTLTVIEKRLLASDAQRFTAMSTAHRYYLYCLQQEQCARDLDSLYQILINEFKDWRNNPINVFGKPNPRPSPQSIVMAVRTKSDILDRVLKTGQEMGIIQKRVKEIRVEGDLNLSAMPTAKLKAMMEQRLNDFKNLVDAGKLPRVYQKMLKEGAKRD